MSTLIEVSEFEIWFKKYQHHLSKLLIAAITAGALYTLYTQRQRGHINDAAVLLAAAEAGAEKHNATALQGATEQLRDHYADTHHASLAMLQLARYQAEQKQWKESETSTRWVIEHAPKPVFADIARLHLAQLQIQDQKWDAALSTLAAPFSEDSFKPAVTELVADVNAIKGSIADARTHYQKALNAQPQGHPYRELIQHKINSLTP